MHKSFAIGLLLACVAAPALAAPATKAAAAPDAVAAGDLVFPSAAAGTHGKVLEQVDEIVATMDARLRAAGAGGIGNMMQHTIYLKDGAASPIEVLGRFHADARKLAPSLVTEPSVGTIIRVPEFTDKNTLVAVDLVAGAGQAGGFARQPFTYGPKEIVETIGTGPLVFTAGLEAMDFQNGKLVPGIDEQIDVIVAKLDGAMRKAGLTVGNMISHNLYVTRGTDPIHVIEKFHAATRKYSPGLKDHPSVGTRVLVDGMAVPGFLLEIDAVATNGDPAALKRVPFTEMPMDIAKTVDAGGFVFVAGMEGVDFANSGKVSPDVMQQVDAAARKLDGALRQAGSSVGDVVKYKMYVKKGADAEAVRAHFRAAVAKLAGNKPRKAAETLVIVEGLAGPALQFEVSAIAARR